MKRGRLFAVLLLCSFLHGAAGVRPKTSSGDTPTTREETEKRPRTIMSTYFGVSGRGSLLHIHNLSELANASGPVVNRKQRLLALTDTLSALNASGVEHVTAYGTTLGIVREGNILEWDDDLDFIVSDETFHLVRPALEKIRIDMWVRLCAGDMYRAQAEGWGPIDIYRVSYGNPKREQSSNESQLLCEWQDEVVIPRNELFPAKFVQPKGLAGLTVPLPHMPERHLEHFYGPDWRTPTKNYKGPWNGNGRARTGPVMNQYHRLCGKLPYRPIPHMEDLKEENAVIEKTTEIVPQRWVAAGLLIPLIVAAWLTWKPIATNWNHAGFAVSKYEMTIAGLYMTLSASATLAIRQTQGSALQMTIEACLLLYMLKASISLGLLLFKQSMSFGEIVKVLQQKSGDMHLPVWGNLAVLGCLFASYDMLSFLAGQKMPPVSFQLLLNCRTLFIVPLQWRLTGKKISITQMSALLLIAFAACSLGRADLFSINSKNDSNSAQDYMLGIALVFGKVILSGLGLVINEKMLKELPLTVDVQNVATYSFSMVFLSVGLFCRSTSMANGASVGKDMASVWGHIFSNAWMILAVVIMAALGIVCAYLLKAFSAMEKEFMGCAVVALLAGAQSLIPGEHGMTVLSIESALIILFGCAAYRLNEPPQEAKPEIK